MSVKLDPALGIDWPTEGRDGTPLSPALSPKDAAAPTLEEARGLGLLPDYTRVKAFIDEQTARPRHDS